MEKETIVGIGKGKIGKRDKEEEGNRKERV